MPRPCPPDAAAAANGLGDFDYLLRELSAEFERLRQQNVELARKCEELCRARGLERCELLPPSPAPELEKLGRAPVDSGALQVCTFAEPAVAGKAADAAAASSPTSAWRGALEPKQDSRLAQLAGEERTGTGSKSTSFLLPGDPAPSPLSAASKTVSLNLEDDDRPRRRMSNSSAQLLPSASQYVSMTSKTTPAGKQVYELFRDFDIEDRGFLTLEDLVRILIQAGEIFQKGDVVNVIRWANRQELMDSDAARELGSRDSNLIDLPDDEHDGLGVDFEAFTRMLDDMPLPEELPEAVEECLHSFRKACMPKSRTRTNIHIQAPKPLQKRRSMVSPEVRRMTIFWLETMPTIVILLNSLVTGISTDHPSQEDLWQALEYVFVTFYTLEFVVKMGIYGVPGYFFGPQRWWNMFDFTCLLISLADVIAKVIISAVMQSGTEPDLGPLLLIKIFRLARLARLVRTLRFKVFYELKLMILGVFSGLRVLTWAIVLLVVLVYVFGVAMTQLMGSEQEFKNVFSSMFTLFRCWTGDCAAYNGTPLAEGMRLIYGPAFSVFYVLMTMFITVGLFNLIMAIFIDNVTTGQMMRKHKEMAEKSKEIELRFKKLFTEYINQGVKEKVKRTIYGQACDQMHSFRSGRTNNYTAEGEMNVEAEWERLREMEMTVTREVFRAWLGDKAFIRLLEDAEIETGNHFELFDVLDVDMGGELSMDELTHGLMKLRGPVTKSDIVAVRLKVRHLTKIIEHSVLGVDGGDMMMRDSSIVPNNSNNRLTT